MDGTTKSDVLKRLAKQGHVRNKGKWTSAEVDQLNINMEEFLNDHDVKDFMGFINVRTKEDRIFEKDMQRYFKDW